MSDNNFTIRPIDLFKVLSDPTRLKIFQILFKKEARCVGDLVDMLDQPQQTIKISWTSPTSKSLLEALVEMYQILLRH